MPSCTHPSRHRIAAGFHMLNIPVIRWGQPYDSLEKADVVHCAMGEPIALLSHELAVARWMRV